MRNYSNFCKSLIIAFLIFSFTLTSCPVFAQTEIDTESAVETADQPLIDNEQEVEKPEKTTTEPLKSNEAVVKSSLFQGGVQLNVKEPAIFTGEKKQVHKGSQVELTVSTVIGSDVSMQGDEFFAEVTDEKMIDGGVVIPIGTVAHGTITETQQEKRLGRNGYVKIKFDYLITPDGREIPVDAEMSTKSHPITSFAKVALTDAGYTLAGGALGGLLALKLGGLGVAIASHGYSIAGGAALGGTIGAAQSLIRKGKPLMINPGDKINMKISSNIELPVLKNSAIADAEKELSGLKVEIFGCKFEKDPFGTPNTITINVNIVNKSENTFSFFDVALIDEYGDTFYPTPFGDTSMWFQKIKPGSKLNGELSFSVNNYKQKHWLVFYDKYSRKELAKLSIRNAVRKIKTDKVNKKKNNNTES